MLSYFRHFQLHNQLWSLERIGNCPIQLVILSHRDCQSKFSKIGVEINAKVLRAHSEDFVSSNNHMDLPIVLNVNHQFRVGICFLNI